MNEKKYQELIFKASHIERESQNIKENLNLIDNEVKELSNFEENIRFINEKGQKDTLVSIGKRVFMKTKLIEENLYVNVGSGIIVKKSPDETRKIIKNQIKKLTETRMQLLAKLEAYNQALVDIISEVKSSNKK